MNRETLRRLEDNFNEYIAPLLDEKSGEDIEFSWEFQKFIHTKKLRVLSVENDSFKKWKKLLLSR